MKFKSKSLFFLTSFFIIGFFIVPKISSASLPWTQYAGNPVLSQTTNSGFSSVVKDGSLYHMYYGGTSINHATSTDGLSWNANPSNPLELTGSVPMVWKEGSIWYMLFRSFDGSLNSVALATSTNGINWNEYSSNPVLEETSGWASGVEAWGIIKVESVYYMFYSDWEETRKIGIATSTDLINWNKDPNNPIFTGGRFCPFPFKYGNYYYLIVPHYTSGTDYSELELYRDTSPTFYSSSRQYMGVVISPGTSGEWNDTDQDTAFVLTDDIERDSFEITNNQLWVYFAGSPTNVPSTWYTGLIIEPNIQSAMPQKTGATWSVVGSKGMSYGVVYNTTIDIDSNDTPYVAYQDWDKSGKATVKKYNGSSWVTIGTEGFAGNAANSTQVFLHDDNPYLIYRDSLANGAKTTLMKYTDSTNWYVAGTATFSDARALLPSLYVYDDGTATGTPYVGYFNTSDNINGKVIVKKLVNSVWQTVGVEVTANTATYFYVSLVVDSGGTPYVAFYDGYNSNKLSVKKYNGSSWISVGSAGFSAGQADYISLALDNNDVPYVAYRDGGTANKATVMKYNGSSWENVGSAGFSAGQADYTSLAIDNNNIPYVAFKDATNANKITVMKYTNSGVSGWSIVGSAGFSDGQADYTWLDIDSENVPYVAFKDVANANKTTVMKYDGVDITAPFITGLSNDTTPTQSKTWTWDSDDPTATYRYVVNQNATHNFTVEAYGSTKTTIQDSGTGTYYLHVQAKDTADNTSTSTVYAVLDNTPVDNTPPTITGLSNDTTPTQSKTWTWDSDDPTATYRYVVNQNATHNFTVEAYGSTKTTIQDSGTGTYYLHVQAKDTADNTSTSTVYAVLDNTPVDNTPPTITGLSNDTTPTQSKTWTWDSDDPTATYRYVVNQNATHNFTDEVYGTTTSTTQSSGNGTYYLHVQAKDEADNTSNTSVSAILDNMAPIISGLSDDNTSTVSKNWIWSSDDENAVYRYHVTTTDSFVFSDEEYSTTTSTTQSSGDGIYYLYVQAKDMADNISTSTVSAILDNTAPTITILGSNPTSIFLEETYTDSGATATDNIDENIAVTTSGTVNTSQAGTYTITYSAIDIAGNISTSTRIVNVINRPSSAIPLFILESMNDQNQNNQNQEEYNNEEERQDNNQTLEYNNAIFTNGSFIKTNNASTVYFIDTEKNMRHVYPNEAVWRSYFGKDFSFVETKNNINFSDYTLGKNVTFKKGTLFKIPSVSRVYLTDNNGIIHWIKTEAKAIELYGKNWNKLVYDLSEAFFGDYIEGSEVE